jgi:hypothetical protein
LNGQTRFAWRQTEFFLLGVVRRVADLQNCSANRGSVHLFRQIVIGVDPARVHSYNRRSVMDGKASFL